MTLFQNSGKDISKRHSNRATSIEGYEIAQPQGLIVALLILQYPLIEIIFELNDWEVPPSLRVLSVAIQACMIGISLSKDLKIWNKK